MILESFCKWLTAKVQHGETGEPEDVTTLLRQWRDAAARDQLFTVLYPELKRVANIRMQRENADHTLQPTALVGEVFLQLIRQQSVTWQNRAHFLAIASEAMRRILVSHARAKKAEKRGASTIMISLNDADVGANADLLEVLEVDQLLERLAAKGPRAAQVVQLRYFGGLTYDEIGEILGVSSKTAKRDWQVARAWLYTEMAGD